jgi:hypothetical protein
MHFDYAADLGFTVTVRADEGHKDAIGWFEAA